ncbi:uncharacterized protein L969DRAFT_93781 [Mixia osmundae IAM 14324]|uniref:Cell division control protein 73 C-terminal domain-containing protein n=1 Tax=Mixia osmundae (strain CBS 9802 / IAM 14324 / JCM 22182 / KY 12970) TaxID=764103 RepID=G7E9K0_MIXOS|nr:uncharacterized protein L969DRAFT_93781 [Mixia osmundae IAM 14324]KEI39951.1 hypothetical protein L969DRAFT_93781 [Mixia osmundae IAM 14324]GAA99319.1 hypothetical protein E5Q_06014 [Mixia osmundae IAM 14324]
MAEAGDPLKLLTEAITKGLTIALLDEAGTEVYGLGEAKTLSFRRPSGQSVNLPKDTATRVRAALPSSEEESADQIASAAKLDLQTLLFCWLKRELPTGEYINAAISQGTAFVSVQLKGAVIDLLQGKGDQSGLVIPQPSEGTDAQEDAARDAKPKASVYVPNRADFELVKQLYAFTEPIQLMDKDKALRGAKPHDFSNVRDMVKDRIQAVKNDLRNGGKGLSVTSHARPAPEAQAQKRKRGHDVPIIIVSPSPSSLVTMANVKRFLETSQYEVGSESDRAEVQQITHKRQLGALSKQAMLAKGSGSEKEVKYTILDSVETLERFGDWDRVVCVMTTGHEWQFKNYRWEDPKALFQNVKGVHFRWANQIDASMHAKLKSWNVTEYQLQPNQRHTDKSIIAEFWQSLEQWIAAHKPQLNY